MRNLFTSLLVIASMFVCAASAGTLDRVKQTGTFKIGYRTDAAPYAFKNSIGEAAGYSVDLCRTVGVALKNELNLAGIKLEYIPVTAEGRFKAVQDGRIDILCGATTATLARRELVDFSLGTFIDGASVIFKADGPESFQQLSGQKVGVRGGTTTEKGLKETLGRLSVDAKIISVANHKEGLTKLESGDVSAYFADRAILLFLMLQSGDPNRLRLSSEYFSYEPYALAMQRGDTEFRLLVDRTLSRLYRSGAIAKVFNNAFGTAEPSDILKAMYLVNSRPE